MTAPLRTLLIITVGLLGTTIAQAQDIAQATETPRTTLLAQRVGPAFPPMLFPQTSPFPSLSKKTKEIFALRELHAHKFSVANARAVLPSLKNLLLAEKNAQNAAEKALEEERTALLQAEPEEPAPLNSGPQVQIELDRFQQASEKAWYEVQKSVGEDKASTLGRLIGRGHYPSVWASPAQSLRPQFIRPTSPRLPGAPGSPLVPKGSELPIFPGGSSGAAPAPPKPVKPGTGASDSSPLALPGSLPAGSEPLDDSNIALSAGQDAAQATTPSTIAPKPRRNEPVLAPQDSAPTPDTTRFPATGRLFGRGQTRSDVSGLVTTLGGGGWGPTLSLRELVELLEAKVSAGRSK